MTSISQPINPPQASSASEVAASSHSPLASTGGKATQAAGSASSKSSYASATKNSFNTPPVANSNTQPGQAHSYGKSDASSILNNRPPVAVPAVGPIVNGNTAKPSGVGDHGRKPSVTINPAGGPGYISNGAASAAKASASNNIQFGAMDSNSTATKNTSPQPMISGDSLSVNSATNPRMASPQKSPSPIPAPPASGGKPPSALHGQSSSVNFGNFGGPEGNLRASSISQAPMMPGPQSNHLRRESSQSQHSDMSGHGMGAVPNRGAYPPQGGRGRGYSQYGQQTPYSPAQNYRSTPNQPRSGSVTSFQQQNRSYQPFPNSPHQVPRQPHSPMPPNAQPIPGPGGQMPMQGPHMGQPPYGGYPSQPYGYAPNMAPQQGYPVPYGMNPVNPDFMAQWQHMYGQAPQNMVPPQSPRPTSQYPPGPQTPFQGQYGPQQPPPMSRTSSTISGADRPASSMGKSQASMTPAPHAATPSQPGNSPAPKNNSFQRPKKSAGIIIKDPNSGEVVNLKQNASPAPSNKSSTSISATPTPPPAASVNASNSDASHSRTESKSVSKTEGKDLREQLARQHREKEEAGAKAAQVQKDEEEKLKKEKEDADVKQMEAAKAQMDAEAAEEKNKIEAAKAKEAAEAAEAAAKATTQPSDDPPAITDEDIARWEAEDEEQRKKEAEAEAAYNKKKQVEKDEAARKEAEAFKMADEEMKKAEREAEEAEEARIREREKGTEEADKPASDTGTPTKIPGTPEIETPGDSGAATPSDTQAMPPPDRAAPKQKPTALKLETTRSVEPPQPSAALMSLRSARKLISLDIGYPPDKASPNPAINKAAKQGKFRYDREFLLQFKTAFTDKPSENWSEKIKETVGDTGEPQSARGTPRAGGGSIMGPRQPSNRPLPPMQQQMGNFGQARTLPAGTTSQQRFEAANRGGGMARGPQNMQNPFALTGKTGSFPQAAGAIRMDRTPSSTSLAHPNSPRTASQRGGSQRGSRTGRREDPKDNKNMPLTAGANLKPIEVTSTGWKPRSVGTNAMASGPAPGGESLLAPDVVQRKVKSNLNKMTPNNFNKISDQILAIAHQSKDEDDGRSLRQVIQLTFEKATDEEHWAEMYAQFCKRMLDSMSQEIKDKGIVDKKGDVVTGGSLFRKYLLTRCQTEFERGWKMHLPEKPEGSSQETTMLSDEYYQAAAAKRRGLGLVRFIGELYKLQMLTERIMHECVKKLVDYDGTPDEAEIESLTSLLKTIGQQLDASEKGRSMMDAYFSRINTMIAIKDLPSRLKFMLMDVVDLRLKLEWKPRGAGAVKGPTTIEAVRTQAQEQDRQREAQRLAESSRRGAGGGRPPMGRGDARAGNQFGPPQPDYQRNTVGMDELRRLGRRQAGPVAAPSFGPTSMFASARGSNTRRPLLNANANDSGASSRVSTPPAQKDKKEKEENAKSGANTFSLLATEDAPGDATSPGPSPAPAKAQLATSKISKEQPTDGESSNQKP